MLNFSMNALFLVCKIIEKSADNDFLAVADIDAGCGDVVDADALEIVDNLFSVIIRADDYVVKTGGILVFL